MLHDVVDDVEITFDVVVLTVVVIVVVVVVVVPPQSWTLAGQSQV